MNRRLNLYWKEIRSVIRAGLWVVFFGVLFASAVSAEVRVIEKEVEEVVASDQSREQVEAFALQKAKRLAVEEAGTFIASRTVVKNFQLALDEVTALASGVVQAKIVGVPAVWVADGGVVHIRVKASIQVDTAVLDRQVEEIMKEKGALKKLEEERKKVRELEERLAGLKSTELKRLEDLNAQALALEREREKQRLFREEQALKAQGELKKAELERLQNEKEMQDRIRQTIEVQEKERKREAELLAKEQDRVRRAQLENEQRWNELTRKAQLTREQWIPIDDSLSLKQAIEEAKQLKAEIAALKGRLDFQLEENRKNLRSAYAQQIALTTPKLPPEPAGKDPFETTEEHNRRLAERQDRVNAAQMENDTAVEKLKAEENLKIAEAELAFGEQSLKMFEPFIGRLMGLCDRKFWLPEEAMTVELGEPEADEGRFPLSLKNGEKTWKKYWQYTDRAQARDFYKTRAYLKAEGQFRLEENEKGVGYRLTAARVSHPGTGEFRSFFLEEPVRFSEVEVFLKLLLPMRDRIKVQFYETETLHKRGGLKAVLKDATTGMEFVFIPGGCYWMGDTSGNGWFADEKPAHKVCVNDFYMGKYEVTVGEWMKLIGGTREKLKESDRLPVSQVSWNDAQEFLRKASQPGKRYRLPTEAEWEYAARSGGQDEQWAGTSNESNLEWIAWWGKNSGGSPNMVGKQQPNRVGLYDMTGNVMEWCSDWYEDHYYEISSRENPQGPGVGEYRVLRGGSWNNSALEDLRASRRSWANPDNRFDWNGFRVVLPAIDAK